ncbi:MAG: site-specific DNA-methyltransferase [Desulfuromonadales bacterium]|nr:site-specific DNA-methyltransferase [Desulfuromonadales bacterium]
MMKKLTDDDPESKSPDLVAENIDRLKALFPELITEGPDGVAVNLDVLKSLVGDRTVTDAEEKYGLNWHGKRRARQLALTPSTGTLRPCPEDSVDWDTTQNLMIEGDNLEVLKLLQKSYAGKVKLIYIDPPYNTGKDFVYPDNFQDSIKNYLELTGQVEGGSKMSSNTEASGRFHTDWLNMIYPRLKVARNLLREDGAIFISIDEKEIQNLRFVCGDIFGEECFVAAITVLCNPKGRSQDKYFATNHEYVMVYSKSPLPKGAFAIAKDDNQIEAEYPEEDDGGKYRVLELRNTHREFGKHNRRNLFYPLYANNDGEVFIEDDDGLHKVLPIWDDGFEGCWTWDRNKAERDSELLVAREVNGRWKIYRKSYASGADRMLKTILLDKAYYTERGQKVFNSLFGTKAKLFQSPKSPYLLSQLFQTITSDSDVILDFFSGSGTTGHSVMAQNQADGAKRRYILTQLPESLDPKNIEQRATADYLSKLGKPLTITELTKERLRRAGAKIKADNPMFAGDLGFRVFKLASSNIRAWEPDRDKLTESLFDSVDHLKTDRTEQDILFELLLKLGLDLCVPIEIRQVVGAAKQAHEIHSIGAGSLLVCLSPTIPHADVEPLALGLVDWHKQLNPAGETTVVFRDSAFADDVAKTNLAAILQQHGLETVRSL